MDRLPLATTDPAVAWPPRQPHLASTPRLWRAGIGSPVVQRNRFWVTSQIRQTSGGCLRGHLKPTQASLYRGPRELVWVTSHIRQTSGGCLSGHLKQTSSSFVQIDLLRVHSHAREESCHALIIARRASCTSPGSPTSFPSSRCTNVDHRHNSAYPLTRPAACVARMSITCTTSA